MDFIEWCGRIFVRFMRIYTSAGIDRTVGVGEYAVATVWGLPLYTAPAYEEMRGVIPTTLSELAEVGLLEEQRTRQYYKPSDLGRQLKDGDLTLLWQAICQEELDDEERALLEAVAALSEKRYATYADIDWIPHEELLEAVRWEYDRTYAVAEELSRRFLIGFSATMGAFRTHVTYRGLVWLRKQGETEEAQFIDALLTEGETTSIEIKREQHTDTNDQKVELIKDVLSLVNTKSSGDRWLIIGFDDKTRAWHTPPDPKLDQNHLEQLMSAYTEPVVDLRYVVSEARGAPFGKLQILRDPTKLPYRVKKGLRGEKREIVALQVFVRHGSQVEEPTPAELQQLVEEGQRARGEL